MADAAVVFLLENLQQLLLYHVHLIKDAKEEVEQLERDLRLFKSFLKDSTKKRCREDSLRELVCQIRDVVYEAKDVIDAFVTNFKPFSKTAADEAEAAFLNSHSKAEFVNMLWKHTYNK